MTIFFDGKEFEDADYVFLAGFDAGRKSVVGDSSECHICNGAVMVTVHATRYTDANDYLKPSTFREQANFCPRCGKFVGKTAKDVCDE